MNDDSPGEKFTDSIDGRRNSVEISDEDTRQRSSVPPIEPTPPHPVQNRIARYVLFFLFVIAIVFFVALDLKRFLTLESLRDQQFAIQRFYTMHPYETIALYFLTSVIFVVCCLPAASLVMLASGAIFGFLPGTLICSVAVTVGAVVSLLTSRFLLRESVERRFHRQAAFVNRGLEREGAYFLMTMRLLPMMPYFITNLLMGLTDMPVRKFWIVSQLSSLPAIMVYANAGTMLKDLRSISDIWSPRAFLSLTLLAIFPFAARLAVRTARTLVKK